MIVTFYKNCKLNNTYQEVFDCKKVGADGKSALETYLDTLEYYMIKLETSYRTINGLLNLDISFLPHWEDVYQINYIKFVDEKITRYCFVDQITSSNEIAQIRYSEDIWHSYSKYMTIKKGHMSNSLVCKYGDRLITLKGLPLKYETNDDVDIKYMYTTNDYRLDYYYVFAMEQVTELTSSKDVSKRYVQCGIFETIVPSTGEKRHIFTISEILNQIINNVTQAQTLPINNELAEFANFIIIPATVFISSGEEQSKFEQDLKNWTPFGRKFINDALYLITPPDYRYKIDGNERTVKSDYKNIAVGTYAHMLPIINNGKDTKVNLTITVTQYSIKVLMKINVEKIIVK